MGTQTVSKNKKSKAAKSALVVVLALALALGGTFAAFYGTQLGTNRARMIDAANPGGRAHDDFGNKVVDGNVVSFDKNIYAESFPDREGNGESLVARIRLKEYMEVGGDGLNPGAGADAAKPTDSVYKNIDTYKPITCSGEAPATTLTSNLGLDGVSITLTPGQASDPDYNYIPTFNRTKSGAEALKVDVKGALDDADGEYSNYPQGVISGNLKLLKEDTLYDDGSADKTVSETHSAKATVGNFGGVISLTGYNALTGDAANLDYWVYDESEGWFYWSRLVKPDTATPLLLNGISISSPTKDWFYELNVEAEFVTPDEIKNEDGTNYWKSSDADKIEITSDSVYAFLTGVSAEAVYRDKVATAINAAEVMLDHEANDWSSGDSVVDLSPGTLNKENQFRVLYRDKDARRALVQSAYTTNYWGDDNSGYGVFDSTGSLDWATSEAKTWCDETYFAKLPRDLQEMIPETTYSYVALDASAPTTPIYKETSGKVFFLSRADMQNRFGTSAYMSFTVPSVGTLFRHQWQLSAMTDWNAGSKREYYWQRDAVGSNGQAGMGAMYTSYWGLSAIPNTSYVLNDGASHGIQDIGARPAFWINY